MFIIGDSINKLIISATRSVIKNTIANILKTKKILKNMVPFELLVRTYNTI